MSELNPTLLMVPTDRYKQMYHEDVEDRPTWDRIIKPRAYVTQNRGGEDGAIIVNEDWFTPRKQRFYEAANDLTGARIGLQGLLAHEYGHLLYHEHPSEFPDKYLDVMGAPSLRIRDRHSLMERSQEWREGST